MCVIPRGWHGQPRHAICATECAARAGVQQHGMTLRESTAAEHVATKSGTSQRPRTATHHTTVQTAACDVAAEGGSRRLASLYAAGVLSKQAARRSHRLPAPAASLIATRCHAVPRSSLFDSVHYCTLFYTVSQYCTSLCMVVPQCTRLHARTDYCALLYISVQCCAIVFASIQHCRHAARLYVIADYCAAHGDLTELELKLRSVCCLPELYQTNRTPTRRTPAPDVLRAMHDEMGRARGLLES